MPKILLANHYDDAAFSILQELTPAYFELAQLDSANLQELEDKITDCDYLIASGRLPLNREVLSHAKQLKMIVRTGVGLDTIDLEALSDLSIPLYVNEGINSESVAEHTLLLILAALKNLEAVAASTRSGKWQKRGLGLTTHELANKKVFVVGLGNIGRRVQQLLRPFGCEVDGSDSLDKEALPQGMLDADIITLHCALTNETKHLLNKDSIARLKPGCIVINTARGGLIEESALAEGLMSGQIGFACLDVREEEPPSAQPFSDLENVILTPHIGGVSYESFSRMLSNAMDCIIAFDKGDSASIESRKVKLSR